MDYSLPQTVAMDNTEDFQISQNPGKFLYLSQSFSIAVWDARHKLNISVSHIVLP